MSCGQAFRWRKRSDGTWGGVVKDKLVELDVKDGYLLWRTYPHGDKALVEDYLRLSEDVNAVYAALADADPRMIDLTRQFRGLRFLRQDPTEALLSFVCSAANSIPRITIAVEELAINYGELVCEIGGICYYAFPTPKAILAADANILKSTKSLGFRGRIIRSVAQQLEDRGEGWLESLRLAPYLVAKKSLVEMNGIGPKIADCVCLFSLDKDEAVPVDTHVRQIAQRLFLPEIKSATITGIVYRNIAQTFQNRYGKYAGWAQQFLFYEDLLRTRALGRGSAGAQSAE